MGKCDGCGKVCCDLSWQIFLIIIEMAGIVLSICTVVDCRFYVVTYMWGNGMKPSNPPNITGLGLFTYEFNPPDASPVCKRYIGSTDISQYGIDDPIKAGGAFGTVALFLGFVGWVVSVFTLFLLCCLQMKGVKWIIGAFFIVSMICQGLTFLFVATDVCWKYNEEIGAQPQCNIGASAGFSIGAIVLYLWAGVQSCAMSWPEKAIGKEKCCSCCKKDEVEDLEAQKEEEAAEEEEKGGGEEEKPEEKPEAPPEEDPNAAAAAAAGVAGGAAVVAAAGEDEEEKEEVEEGDTKDEEMAEETKEDVKASTKSDFSEDEDDDASSFEEDNEDEEEGETKNEEEKGGNKDEEEGNMKNEEEKEDKDVKKDETKDDVDT